MSTKDSKKSKFNSKVKEIEIFPEDIIQILPVLAPQYTSSSSSIKVIEDNYKLYSLDYSYTETFLLEYNTDTHLVDRVSLGVKLFPESGFLNLTANQLIISGGMDLDCGCEVKNVFILKVNTVEIVEVCPMLYVKRRLRLVQALNFVYAIGGVKQKNIRNGNQYTIKQDYSNSFSRYSLLKNEWELMSDLPISCESPACFASADKIYVMGGCFAVERFKVLDTIQVFDLNANAWSISDIKLPDKVYGHTCQALYEDCIIIFGGLNKHEDPNRSSWKFSTSKISLFNRLPAGCELYFPYCSYKNKNEVYSFNEANDLFTLNLKLSEWTISQITDPKS